jgi:Chemoreceptor zinc-binding domain
MAFEEQIDKAIGAHGIWKMRLRTAIASGKVDASPSEVAKDNACAFGQWLYGPGLSPAVRASAEYANVRAQHANFHKCAAKVLECVSHGDKAQAAALMDGEYRKVSSGLNAAMMKWKIAAHR